MKAIILDFMRRYRRAYILLTLFQLFLFLVDERKGPDTGLRMGAVFAGLSGSVLLSLDLMGGPAKVLRMLPVSLRDSAQALWCLGVAIPNTITAVAMVLGLLVHGWLYPAMPVTYARLPLVLWLTFAYSGTMYFLLTMMPAGIQHGFWNNVRGGLVGGLWGGSIGGSIFLADWLPVDWSQFQPAHGLALGAGTLLGVIAWFRSEQLLIYRASLRPASAGPATGRRYVARLPGELAGLRYLWWTAIWQSAALAVVFLSAVAVVQLLFGAFMFRELLADPARYFRANSFVHNQMGTMICLLLTLRWLQTLRSWRVLPMTTRSLSVQLFLLPLVPLLVFWAIQISMGIAAGVDLAADNWIKVMPCLLGLVSWIVPLALRIGMSLLLLPLIMVCGGFGPLVLLTLTADAMTWPVSMVLGSLLLGGGYLFSTRLITHRSETYRPFKMAWAPMQ